jgi:hypothetical protein
VNSAIAFSLSIFSGRVIDLSFVLKEEFEIASIKFLNTSSLSSPSSHSIKFPLPKDISFNLCMGPCSISIGLDRL